MPLAVFFELFWLDLFPIGSYVPPMPALPYLLILSLASVFSWDSPVALAFPLALSLPAAYLIPFYENKLRISFSAISSRLVRNAEAESGPLKNLPLHGIGKAWLIHSGIGMVFFFLPYTIIRVLFSLPFFSFLHLQPGVIPLNVSWPVLYVIAAIGAVLSLRIRRAYVTFAMFMATLMILRFV